MIISVNWCDHHRIQYPCDRFCPLCTKRLGDASPTIRRALNRDLDNASDSVARAEVEEALKALAVCSTGPAADCRETVAPYWNTLLECTSETCHRPLPCLIHGNSATPNESLRDMLAEADRAYMEDDTPQSTFAEDLLDKLAEFIPFERTK